MPVPQVLKNFADYVSKEVIMRFRVLLGVNLALHSVLVIVCIYALLKLRTKAKGIAWPPVVEGQGLQACYID